MRPLTIALLVAAALAGCGDRSAITAGGEVPGDIVTVYVLVPYTPAGRDLIRGAKRALSEAGGRAGKLTVQFASLPEPDDAEGIAAAVREIVHDTGTIAVIGDLDERTAAISAPLLNAVGFLHVSPIGPLDPEQPAPWRTFFGFGPVADPQAAGNAAMNSVLDALRRAGPRARSRRTVIDAYRPPATPATARP